jgi:HNH endonuclease
MSKKFIGSCIYCGSESTLSDEHVIPFGLGGNIILEKASCKMCADITSNLELKLLRGHWWPYRLFLGHKSRGKNVKIPNIPIKITHSNGTISGAELPMQMQTITTIFELFPPTILNNEISTKIPYAQNAYIKYFAPLPTFFTINNKRYYTIPSDKVEIPINFDSVQLFRFLAKIAHGYAIFERGPNTCTEYFLPPIILGNIEGAMTYVGGTKSEILGKKLPGNGIHALMDRINGNYLTVYIQLFRDDGDLPPIYEVVVGKLKS